MDETDGPRVKTMLNVASPASGPPRVVGPPELVIAENDALRARVAKLEAVERAACALFPTLGHQYTHATGDVEKVSHTALARLREVLGAQTLDAAPQPR